MGLRKIHSIQVGLVINLFTGLIKPQYSVIFDEMFSTVTSFTAVDTEVWIRLVS